MAIELTQNAILASEATGKTPVIVLKFANSPTLYGPVVINKYIRIGDPDLYIGDDWVIGGFSPVVDQSPYVQLSYSTSVIRQQIEPDRSSASSVSSMKIRLIDYRQEITELITPGNTFVDPLGQRATIYFGFSETAWPEDYIVAFSGVLESIDSGPGWVDFSLNNPEELKRVTLFDPFDTKLNGAINLSTTSIVLDDTSGFILPADVMTSYILIDNEFIQFIGKTPTTITGVTRGALLTTDARAGAVAHDDNADVAPFYILEDNVVTLALKLMLSQGPTSYATSLAIESLQSNNIFFKDLYLIRDNNVSSGDILTTTGCSIGGNNQSNIVILSVQETDDGTIVYFVSATFTAELASPGVASIKSQFNVLPVGAGMLPSDVDIARHEYIRETFAASYTVRYYIDDDFKLKEFMDNDLYASVGMFSIPRGGKASVGIHIPPLPIDQVVYLNQDNIKSPASIVLKRGMNTNFQNAVIYKLDRDLYEEKFRKGVVTANTQSIIDIGKRRDYKIDSGGLRSTLSGETIATAISNRRLERYNRGSEYITGIKMTLKDGMRLEPGDVVVLDPAGLSISNTIDGTRDRPAQFWEVTNREFNLKGEVTVDLTQTNYLSTNRYGLISPSSKVESGTTTAVLLKSSYQSESRLGPNEYQKWTDYIGAVVRVRNAAYTIFGDTTIATINDNVITFGTALAFTPAANYIMEFTNYDVQTSDAVKLVYVHLTDDDNPFADGGEPYRII